MGLFIRFISFLPHFHRRPDRVELQGIHPIGKEICRKSLLLEKKPVMIGDDDIMG